MTLSLIWQPRQVQPIIGPALLSGELLARTWAGTLHEGRYSVTGRGPGWSGRQIARWESTYGRSWAGRHGNLPVVSDSFMITIPITTVFIVLDDGSLIDLGDGTFLEGGG